MGTGFESHGLDHVTKAKNKSLTFIYKKTTPENSLNSALIREQIGRLLRNHYQACTSQELPPRLLALLKKLDQVFPEEKDQ